MSKSYQCHWCNSPDHVWRPNRREFLYVGLLGSLGLSLLEVGGLSALRSWLVAAFGFTWGV